MGYSVYITLTKRELPRIERFVDEMDKAGAYGSEDSPGAFGNYVRGPLIGDLSYVDTKHEKSGLYVGCDYGAYWIAHTIVNRLAALMGKDHFIYDGVEKVATRPDERILFSRTSLREFTYDIHLATAKRFGMTVMTPEEFSEVMRQEKEFQDEHLSSLNRAADAIESAWEKATRRKNAKEI